MGGKRLETSAVPLSFHPQFIWCPVEFMIFPPAKGCCISSQSAFQPGDRLPVVRPASLPFNKLEGLNGQ